MSLHQPEIGQQDMAAFIRQHTMLAPVPLAPEIRLYQATEITPIWHATEDWMREKHLPPPYWAFAWAGGQAMARFIAERPDIFMGKRVLDFAAGSGLGAIAAIKAGAHQVTASEVDAFAIESIKLNMAANDVTFEVVYANLIGHDLSQFDVIMAGDVCYQQVMANTSLKWLRAQVARGMTVILGDPGRAYFPKGGFIELAHYRVPVNMELEDSTERATKVVSLLETAPEGSL